MGIALARVLKFPAGWLLGPLLVAGLLSMWGVLGPVGMPPLLASAGYALIGLQVGLRFTRASLAHVGKLLLSALTGVPALDAYLATTPGGLYAVLATGAETGADVTFILAVQVIRLILVLFCAPFIAAWFRRRGGV